MTLSSDEDSGLSIATAHPDSDMESAVCSEAIMYAGRELRTGSFRLGVWEWRFVVDFWLLVLQHAQLCFCGASELFLFCFAFDSRLPQSRLLKVQSERRGLAGSVLLSIWSQTRNRSSGNAKHDRLNSR